MKFYVLDLEYNQYFNFPDDSRHAPEPACPSEIIQAGVVALDERCRVTETKNAFVKPRIFRRMHPFVQKITGLSMKDLSKAPSFCDVYAGFFEFARNESSVLCTWGADDIKELYKNVWYHGLDSQCLTRKFLNVQKLAGVFLGLPSHKQIGLKTAAEAMGIQMVKPFHNAINDAEYTAEILSLLLDDKTAAAGERVQTLDTDELRTFVDSRVNAVNIKLLNIHAERVFRRKLDNEEREAVLNIYNSGRFGKFDTKTH